MPSLITLEDTDDRFWKVAKYAGIALLGATAVAALGAWLARDQMVRHRRDLFSPHPLQRLAALGYLRSHPDVDNVLLLRDYLAWEERPLLRKRAAAILDDMEERILEVEEGGGGA
ncbi:MAG: hypothetical protein ACOC83_07345 [Gemmatimonadota bacterium]